MNEAYCPNCRTERADGDLPCPQCGWMPLRSTEIQFVDDRTMACPRCGRQRPVSPTPCSYCGSRDLLEPTARHAVNFRISSLMLLTALVAFCLVLGRVAVVLGILAFGVFGLAALRTALLIRERKRFRYPVFTRDMLQIFALSIFGILVAIVVFIAVSFLCALPANIIASLPATRNAPLSAMFITVAIVGLQGGAVYLIGLRRERRGMILAGAATGWITGAIVVGMVASGLNAAAGLAWLILIAVFGLIVLTFGCQRGGAIRARALVVGYSIGLSTLGGTVFLLVPGGSFQGVGIALAMSSFFLWPILLSIMTLEGLWSWDDAFPRVARRASRDRFSGDTEAGAATAHEDDGAIQFLDAESDQQPEPRDATAE